MIVLIGCFGNSPVDRWIEHQVNQYCNVEDTIECPNCKFESIEDDFGYDELQDLFVCPDCLLHFDI